MDSLVATCFALLCAAVAVWAAVRLIESVAAVLLIIAAVIGGLFIVGVVAGGLWRRHRMNRW